MAEGAHAEVDGRDRWGERTFSLMLRTQTSRGAQLVTFTSMRFDEPVRNIERIKGYAQRNPVRSPSTPA